MTITASMKNVNGETNILNIFSSNIIHKKLNLNTKELITYALNLSTKRGRNKSNKGGFQSFDLDEKEKIFCSLINQIQFTLDEISLIDNLKNQKYRLTNFWFNVNYYKDYNMIHHHRKSAYSGALYLQCDELSGNLKFYHPAFDCFCDTEFTKIEKNFLPHTSSIWEVPPIINQLYVFPSWLKHSVEPNLSTNKRISMSFNSELIKV